VSYILLLLKSTAYGALEFMGGYATKMSTAKRPSMRLQWARIPFLAPDLVPDRFTSWVTDNSREAASTIIDGQAARHGWARTQRYWIQWLAP
jgi:hypothetical protein